MKKILSIIIFSVALVSCGKAKEEGVTGQSNGARSPAPSGGPSIATGKGNSSLFPLKQGYEWEYEMEGRGNLVWCQVPASKTRKLKVSKEETKAGETFYTVDGTICSSTLSSLYTVEGDKVFNRNMGAKLQILEKPADNAGFIVGNTRYRWKNLNTITVSGKTYSDCWRLKLENAVVVSYQDYCRGYGTVNFHYDDGRGNSVSAKLK